MSLGRFSHDPKSTVRCFSNGPVHRGKREPIVSVRLGARKTIARTADCTGDRDPLDGDFPLRRVLMRHAVTGRRAGPLCSRSPVRRDKHNDRRFVRVGLPGILRRNNAPPAWRFASLRTVRNTSRDRVFDVINSRAADDDDRDLTFF